MDISQNPSNPYYLHDENPGTVLVSP